MAHLTSRGSMEWGGSSTRRGRGWRRRAPRRCGRCPSGARTARWRRPPASGSRVGRDQDVGAGGDDVRRLAVAELAGRLGVEDVVDAGRAAAQLGLGDLAQLQPGDRPRAARAAGCGRPGRAPGGRRRGRRPSRRAGAGGDRAELAEDLRDVAHLRANARARSAYAGSSRSSSAYSFIVEPQPAALTTTCSTPGRLEGVDQRAGVPLRLLLAAVVHRQRAAAALAGGTTTSQPSAAQHPRGGGVDPGKNSRCTQPVSMPTTAPRRVARAGTRGRAAARRSPSARRQALHRGELRRQPLEQAGAAQRPVEAAALEARSGPRRSRSRWGAGTARRSARAAAGRRGCAVVALDLRAGLPR